MTAATFDTYKLVMKLKKAGFDEPQAEAVTEAVKESHESADFATKRDIGDLRQEISELRKELHKDMEMLRKDLIIKLGGIVIGAVTVIPLISKTLHLSM